LAVDWLLFEFKDGMKDFLCGMNPGKKQFCRSGLSCGTGRNKEYRLFRFTAHMPQPVERLDPILEPFCPEKVRFFPHYVFVFLKVCYFSFK
jgi:hypothetical protein